MGGFLTDTAAIMLGLGIKIMATSILAFYIWPRQMLEVLRPHNQFTKLRWMILIFLSTTIICLIPGIAYQYLRLLGQDIATLRTIATIMTNISLITFVIMFTLIFNYHYEE